MYKCEREGEILALLNETEYATVEYLSKKMNISASSIRRDLKNLEDRGLVQRSYGGVKLSKSNGKHIPFSLRSQENSVEKKQIAKAAMSLINPNDVIFLDASSTVMYLIKYLENFENLTVITNGIQTAQELQSLSHRIYCTGGMMLHQSSAYVGQHAENFIRQFNADLFFFSSQGLSEDGRITDDSEEETHVRKVMLEQSRKKIFLCDHSKVGPVYCHNLCRLEQVDDYITDAT